MKNKSFVSKLAFAAILLMFSFSSKSFAFTYNISFTGSGASSNLGSVEVQNITKGTTGTVPSGNILSLSDGVSAVNQLTENVESLQIYPNPIKENATISFNSKLAGVTQINVLGVDGRKLAGIIRNTDEGENLFQLSLPKGAYTIQVIGIGFSNSTKVISQAINSTQPNISFIGSKNTNTLHKSKSAVTSMPYTAGDLLLFKASSGNYITMLSDIITASKTINFNFVECKDADGNYYPIVNIGTQVWMAENLKTSQYRNFVAITNKSNDANWGALTTEGFSDYSTPSNSTTYGKFYNWYAVNDSKKLAPKGWHIPTDADWTSLTDFLGGGNVAGNKLKEAGNTHWMTSNVAATNETGFTTLPGGTRSSDGSVYDIGNNGYWWSATEGSNINSGWYRYITNLAGSVSRGYYSKSGGMSVRCVMGEIPVLSTTSISTISSTSCISGGNISFDGNVVVDVRGVCWSTTTNPTIANSKTTDDSGTGAFVSNVTGLSPQTTYYLRAYATNNMGTAYGSEVVFSTALPALTTSAVSTITASSASCGGTVTLATDAATVTARGVCWSTTQNPTITDSKTSNSTGTGTYNSSITGLIAETTYYVRAYATNSVGTSYGTQVSFSTALPTITTTAISGITATTATSGGNATLTTGAAPIISRGVCWSTTANPTIALNTKTSNTTGTGIFTSSITGLTIGTTYYVRAYATNSVGATYGTEVSFSTILPTITTSAISALTATSANCGGEVTAIGGAAVTARGVCWSMNTNPTISNNKTTDGIGIGTFSSSITGLTIGSTYYVRAYATSSIGTAYGSQISFATKLPTIATNAVSSISATTATCGGNVTAIGGGEVTESGVCWSTSVNPTIALSTKTSDGTGIGSFSSSITGLTSETTYYVRSYAINNIGTTYGNEFSFSTKLAVLTTTSISSITATSVNSGGNITSIGGAAVTERGVCWSTNITPTISDNKTNDATGIGTFTSSLSGLTPETTYYLRAYATNSIGTAYGNEISFATTLPTITTTTVSSITATSANSGGNVTAIGGAAVTARGVCWSTTSNPTIALSTKTSNAIGFGTFTSLITGLSIGNTYYVRAYATNSIGTAYGAEETFATTLPTITTSNISAITTTTATCGGEVITSGGATVTSRGICWSTTTNPTISNTKTTVGAGTGVFSSLISGLTGGIIYYVRSYATNSIGTVYGDNVTFKSTSVVPTITTNAITNLTLISASSGGNISFDGGEPITARGVCWSLNPNPTINDNKTADGIGNGNFASAITGLAISTTYYARAYCTNTVGTVYGNEVSLTTNYYIGASYLGGKIAYVDTSGKHGFVCAPTDQSTGINWGISLSIITGASNTILETTGVYGITKSGGRKNTDIIIAAQGVGNYAASICASLTIGGATPGDWYLPSIGELNQIDINHILLGGFINDYYWSSSESGFSAIPKGFHNGSTGTQDKSYPNCVRAVRAF